MAVMRPPKTSSSARPETLVPCTLITLNVQTVMRCRKAWFRAPQGESEAGLLAHVRLDDILADAVLLQFHDWVSGFQVASSDLMKPS